MKTKRTRHVVANALAGLFLGIGMSLMLTIYGVVGWSTAWPNIILVLGIALGLGVGLLPVRTKRRSSASSASSASTAKTGSATLRP